MGDYYQIIADLDARPEQAETVINRWRDWMVTREIIMPEKTDCVLGEEDGHAPGKNYAQAVMKQSAMLSQLKNNGAQFIAERTVFYGGAGSFKLMCRQCGAQFEANDAWSDAVGEWHGGSGPGILACAKCSVKMPITEWQHDPPWAFGNAGLKFWNWPELRPEFVRQFGEVVGHRVRLVWGKI